MIEEITLKFGRSAESGEEALDVNPVTVFVGPNNSGKSLILREIQQFCSNGQSNQAHKIVAGMRFTAFTAEEAATLLDELSIEPMPGQVVEAGARVIGTQMMYHTVHPHAFANVLSDPITHCGQYAQWALAHHMLRLDGQSRIALVNEQKATDLQSPPQTSFQRLFVDNEKRSQVSRIIFDSFGKYLVIDPTHPGHFRLRLSNVAPPSNEIEQGLSEHSRAFHAQASLIDEFSDGVKAFVGMMIEAVAGNPRILMIDEPEAFLHPTLAMKLGREIAKSCAGTGKRAFISTHSPNFVMGCIQSGVAVNIVRLTYRDGAATARLLSNDQLIQLMRNPLLRSTNVLGGLFYENVIVSEADSDRAFYEEINNRLQQFLPELAIPNCLFLNAQNKHTVKTIIKPLRSLGIPAAGIVDVDVVKDGGAVWTSFLDAGGVPATQHQPLGNLRNSVKTALQDTGSDMKTEGGLALLAGEQREAAENLFDQIEQYGLFGVRGGEVESWLQSLDANGHGTDWLIKVFEAMGSDPSNTDYVMPENGDVWEFLGRVSAWLLNPDRRGIPG